MPTKCKTCGGTGELWQGNDLAGRGIYDPCPDCSHPGTLIYPKRDEYPKPPKVDRNRR